MDIDVIDGQVVREDREHTENLRTTAAQGRAQSHLYVMQAQSGRLKVGRSGNPESRRRALEGASGEKIRLLIVLHNRGREELSVHEKLAEYRGIGEWFDCNQTVIDILSAELGESITLRYGSMSGTGKMRKARLEAIAAKEDDRDRSENRAICEKIFGGPIPWDLWDPATEAEMAWLDGYGTLTETNRLRTIAGHVPLKGPETHRIRMRRA